MGRKSAFVYGVMIYLVFQMMNVYSIGFLGNMVVPKSIDSGAEAPFAQALLINAFLLSLFALQHSIMARQTFKTWWTKVIPPPIERSTYVLFASLVMIFLFWQWRPMTSVVWNVENTIARVILLTLFWIGWLLVMLSTCMINHFDLFGLRQVYLYLRNEPYSEIGFKTPALYKYVRHPLMLGFLIWFWATPRMTVGHLVFAVASTVYILVALQFEERDLVRVYGDVYREYKRQVPMLFPLPGKKR